MKFIIQFPGLGKKFIIFGKIKHRKYGTEKPKEMLKKIIITSKFAANIENPTAVPRKGALHGVANKVANAPDKN